MRIVLYVEADSNYFTKKQRRVIVTGNAETAKKTFKTIHLLDEINEQMPK